MRHCVAHYDRHCKAGSASIWSVRRCEAEATFPSPIMTVEVRHPGREIVQARGKCNQSAMSAEAGSLLRAAAGQVIAWAEDENLAIGWGLLGWNRTLLLSNEDKEAPDIFPAVT